MADKKEPGKAQQFFMQHGEKVALGVAAALLVGYLVFAFAITEQDRNATDLTTVTDSIKAKLGTDHPDLGAMKAPSLTNSALAPYTATSQAEGAIAWATGYATTGEVRVNAIDVDKQKDVILATITMATTAEVALDGITIKFSAGAVDKEALEAAIDNYIVERKGKSGQWEILDDKVSGSASSYTDKALDAKTDYAYRVRAVTSDPLWRKSNSPDGRGKPSNEVAAKSLGIWKFSIINAMKGSAEKGQVYMVIEKFDKQHGKVEIKHIHYEGDKIGAWEDAKGQGETTLHRVSLSGGKSIEVDFGSGASLKLVDDVKSDVKFKKCVPLFDKSTGTKTGCETVEDKKTITGVKIVIIDEENKPYVIHRPELVADDQMCEEHGGRKTTSTAPDEKKNKEAALLLATADKEYETDKKKAAASYKNLLDKFGSTDAVKTNKKKIEERSKEK